MELVTDLNDALVTTLNMSIFLEQMRSNLFNKKVHPRSMKRIRHLQRDLNTIKTQAKLTGDQNTPKSLNQPAKMYYCCRAERIHTLPKISRAHLLLKAVSTSNTRLKLSKTGHSSSPATRSQISYKKKSPEKAKQSYLMDEKSFDAKQIVERCVNSFNKAKISQENRLKRNLKNFSLH